VVAPSPSSDTAMVSTAVASATLTGSPLTGLGQFPRRKAVLPV
jgi:hypothetical protein